MDYLDCFPALFEFGSKGKSNEFYFCFLSFATKRYVHQSIIIHPICVSLYNYLSIFCFFFFLLVNRTSSHLTRSLSIVARCARCRASNLELRFLYDLIYVVITCWWLCFLCCIVDIFFVCVLGFVLCCHVWCVVDAFNIEYFRLAIIDSTMMLLLLLWLLLLHGI